MLALANSITEATAPTIPPQVAARRQNGRAGRDHRHSRQRSTKVLALKGSIIEAITSSARSQVAVRRRNAGGDGPRLSRNVRIVTSVESVTKATASTVASQVVM